jgi:hypothetical protein
MIFNGNRETDFYKNSSRTEEGLLGRYYTTDGIDIPKPGGTGGEVELTSLHDYNSGKTDKNKKALEPDYRKVKFNVSQKKTGNPSIFNRYELFYFDNFTNLPNGKGEPLLDSPDRLSQYMNSGGSRSYTESALKNPTAQNLINWSKNGNTVSVEYDWPDFLWCKNYGKVPNNYMVTLRRFSVPAADDLFFVEKALAPDIGRMVTWVDGETNKWESVGLKFSTSLTWKKFESELQSVNVGDKGGYQGGEGKALEGAGGLLGAMGSVMTTLSKLVHPEQAAQQRTQGSREEIDPYHDTMKVHGPVDIVKEMFVREKGINFEQTFTLTFEYELKSIDGINAKLAFMDLFSNVMMVVTNKAKWWGGEIRYWGNTGFRNVKPLGDPSKLTGTNADYGGYLDSIMSTLSAGLDRLTKGKSLMTPEGITNLMSGIGGTLLDGIVGGGLDKMGRPGAIAVNSLLSGEDTGMWHVMVGNPINPIISVGNLIMEKADIEFDGVLGPDDFPNKLKVICTLKPARPRAREGIIDMFHRNGRTYTTYDPKKMVSKINITKRKRPQDTPPLLVGKPINDDDSSRYITQRYDSANHPDHPNIYNDRFSGWLGGMTDDDLIVVSAAQGIF